MASIREGPATRVLLFEVLWEPNATGCNDRPINGENDLNPVTRVTLKTLFEGAVIITTAQGTFDAAIPNR